MYKKYALRYTEKINTYLLEEIKPEEALRAAILGESDYYSIEYSVYRDLKKNATNILNSLTEQEAEIIKYRFGFYGEFFSVRDTGNKVGLSGERVRQLEKIVLRKLRRPVYSMPLRGRTKEKRVILDSDEIVCYRNLFNEKILMHLLGQKTKVGFFGKILKKNNIEIFYDSRIILGLGLDKLGFSIHTCNCLKKFGINTLQDLIKKTSSDSMHIRNLGRKCLEEISEKSKEYGAYLQSNVINENISDRYLSIVIKYKAKELVYKFSNMNIDELAERIFDILYESLTLKNGTIIDYKMSYELKSLLLFKGYFFVEDVINEKQLILEELTLGNYQDYVDEYRSIIDEIEEYFVDIVNPKVEYFVIDSKSARNIIKKCPQNRDELFECLKKENEEKNRLLYRSISMHFPSIISIDVAKDVSVCDSK